ncbi:hypothetical protein PGTUg99_018381 [Puccinia graminis f. sp. tritici]|uniref:Uncharacterized protein n=1 Tax=Puccinia graminis f. sp. tritici TaxID=56615 RepID=A0A5B0QGK4_PUCGR|nr:hypothetical protein PGTUg99_018381 [Puccinia graminis f. sp. tritici]
MVIYRAEQEQIKRLKAQQKAKDKRTKGRGRARGTGWSSNMSALGSSGPGASQTTESGLAPTQSKDSLRVPVEGYLPHPLQTR